MLGDLIGVTHNPIVPGRKGIVFLTGKFCDFPKKSAPAGEELSRGQIVWYNPADKKLYNAENDGYLPIGYAFEDTPSDASVCTMLLQNGLGGATASGASPYPRVTYAPDTDVAAGAILIIGSLVTVADNAISADEPGTLRYSGDFDLPKAPGEINAGQLVYAKSDGKIYGTSSPGAVACGYALEFAESDSPYLRVLLVPTEKTAA
jgi:predicted RecA/RadA family phage recombinase